jgi:hypothetical protein
VRESFRVGSQRRIERAVIGCLVTNDINHRRRGPARVVQIRQTVGEARAAMQQRRRRLFRHPCIAVGGTRHHAFEQAKHAMHAGNPVERGNEVHLRRARIGKAGRHAAVQQRMHQALSAIHRLDVSPVP